MMSRTKYRDFYNRMIGTTKIVVNMLKTDFFVKVTEVWFIFDLMKNRVPTMIVC